MFTKIITVAAIASVEIYAAIGVGMLAELSPHIIFAATLVGGIIGVFTVVYLGERIKAFIAKFKKPKPPKENTGKDKLIRKLWDKYGIFGVGFIGTFLMGAPISIGLGISFGVDAKKLMRWCLLAVAIRCFVFSYFFNFIKKLF
jgi:membrane protein YqaA with SNARE-associated domain